jgi:hypothetical protein
VRSPQRLATTLAALLSFAATIPLFSSGCSLGIPPLLQFGVEVTAAETAAPGAKLDVSIALFNASDITLKKDEVELTFTGDPSWGDASIPLPQDTEYEGTAKLSKTLTVPAAPGRHLLSWTATRDGSSFGDPIEIEVEVTCSDGVFCNGVEQFVNGACASGKNPCDDGEPCTTDTCDEDTGRCAHETSGGTCASCSMSCTPDCNGKECGDDGCGGTCGACGAGKECALATGQCAALSACDHDVPTCDAECGAGQVCGSDCACHTAAGPMADVVVDQDRLAKDIRVETIEASDLSCSSACLDALGERTVLRFSVAAVNQGSGPVLLPSASERSDLYQQLPCDTDPGWRDFAVYRLLDADENVIAERAQARCLSDGKQALDGPEVSCSARYDCTNQGLSAGWAIEYPSTLDCQWLDITDVESGDYTLEVVVNPGRLFHELSFENNVARVPVQVP